MKDESPSQGERSTKADISIKSLFDVNSPWVVAPNGSYKGNFDWVPESYRVGNWSPLAGLVLMVFYAMAVYAIIDWNGWEETDFTMLQYPSYGSAGWFYNTFGGLWMLYIIKTIVNDSPLGFYAWITYTVQSWTLLAIRHVLCAMAPWSTTALIWAEWIRFPCAVSPTITFFLWNFILMPYAYFVAMKDDPRKQRNFIRFCTSFRLLNLHGLNILFCFLNVGTIGSPPRTLEFADLFIALMSTLVYMTFYLLVLDRLGVHLYPVFSPRSPFLIFAWLGALGCYMGTFHVWRYLLSNP